MLKCILFDFDGTLVNTMDSIWEEYQHAIGTMKLKPISRQAFSRNMGKPWDEVIRSCWPEVPPQEFTSHYRFQMEKADRIPGVDQALNQLSKKYTLSILTSRGKNT
jgi:phosphoglycolate phosphatase-like HAD superfamily hydrolase